MTKLCVGTLALVSLVACGGGQGTVQFTTWGESYIEEGIPEQMGDDVGFVDGWSLKYSSFLVVLKEAKIAGSTATAFSQSGALAFDLTRKGPFDVVEAPALAAQRYEKVSFAIAPDDAVTAAGGATQENVDALKSNKASIIIVGTARKGAATKTFNWPFVTNTLYADCKNEELGGTGVNVAAGGNETVQLTIHGDHFFYDDLQAEDAKLRFEALAAADTNNDNAITLEELADVQLTSLPLSQYGTGGASKVKTLKDFVTALSRTIGHYRGEGHCDSTARDVAQ